jgi:conjugative transposon TraM protein
MKKINFKQPKYIIPTIAYVGLLVLGWLFIDLFNVEIKDEEDNSLQTTEYLNSDLPTANVAKDIGSKRKNVRDVFGDIVDRSAVQDFVEDADTTVKKKEDFESKYSEEELKLLQEKEAQAEEIKRLQERLKKSAEKGESMSSDEFSLPMSEEERARALELRRKGMMAELERDLNNARAKGAAAIGDVADAQDSIAAAAQAAAQAAKDKAVKMEENAVKELSDDAENNIVVKKSKEDSDYFNTLSQNEKSSNLIKAIIDEEVKAVEGSRVRLRLLDDIEVNGTLLTKGSYLYATMSGFGQQRVKGKVESVLIGDEILKIGLSIYDTTDGLEGLYVPASSFRETAKDIGSSAMQSNMNMNTMGNGNSMTQWAGQALQNAYQRTSNAISKAIKKNKVRIKYGTQVYLVNSKKEKKR